jgi:hypothetical protein
MQTCHFTYVTQLFEDVLATYAFEHFAIEPKGDNHETKTSS